MKMKKTLLFAFVLICNVVTFAQVDWRIHPNDAKYKIYGRYETKFRNGKAFYELTEVNPVGLTFDKIASLYEGKKSARGDVYFTFDHVTYAGHPDLDNVGLFIYNENTNNWDADSETEARDRNGNETKEMSLMLVLDCSKSLSDAAFAKAKSSAVSFIYEMEQASSAGNIHIGIIGFSSWELTKKRKIEPLTATSAVQMKSFINGLTKGGGTALFRSYDEAFDMLSEYTQNFSYEEFASAAIVTFTDGLDNGSINEDKEIGSKKDYFGYIKENVLQKRIKGVDYLSYTVFLPGGDDVKDKYREAEAVEDLKALAKVDGNYFRVDNASELEARFKNIARDLIERWKVIQCFIAPGQKGQVCWTFGKKENKPTPTPNPNPLPKPKKKSFVGLNWTFGMPMIFGETYYPGSLGNVPGYYESSFGVGLNVKMGLDLAWPISRKFKIGPYFNIGGGYCFGGVDGGSFDFKIGVLMLLGNNTDHTFIIGLAPCTGFGFAGYNYDYINNYETKNTYIPLELRFGRMGKKKTYFTGNLSFGFGKYFVMEPSITIGRRLGQ